MPSSSKKQHNFMAAIAHNPAFAKKVGIPQSVGKDFNEADKGRKFGKGGNTMMAKKPSAMAQMSSQLAVPAAPPAALKLGESGSRADLQRINSPKTNQGKNELFKKGGDTMATKGVNPFAKFEKSGKDVEKKGMKEGSKADMALDKKQMMGMKKGGMAEGGMSDMEQDKAMIKKAFKQHDMQEHKGGKGTSLKLKKGGKAMRFDEGGDVDEQEDDTSALTAYTPPKVMPSRPVSKTPTVSKPAAKPAAKPSFSNYSNEGRNKSAPAETDMTKMSVSDRLKASRAKSREGTTDTRSVGERLRSAFGMAKGGMASGGSFRSSANGIAQRGKTRGKMC